MGLIAAGHRSDDVFAGQIIKATAGFSWCAAVVIAVFIGTLLTSKREKKKQHRFCQMLTEPGNTGNKNTMGSKTGHDCCHQ